MAATTLEESSDSKPGGRGEVLACVAALLIAGGFAVWQLSSWPVRLRYPGDRCSVEGIFLAEMLHLRQGVPIYGPFTADPFDPANYGPVYYLLGAELINPYAPAFFSLRVLSTLATVGCAAACSSKEQKRAEFVRPNTAIPTRAKSSSLAAKE
jgi:hypothetical protein